MTFLYRPTRKKSKRKSGKNGEIPKKMKKKTFRKGYLEIVEKTYKISKKLEFREKKRRHRRGESQDFSNLQKFRLSKLY